MKAVPALQPRDAVDAALVSSLLLLGLRVMNSLEKDEDGFYFIEDEDRERCFDLLVGTVAFVAGTGKLAVDQEQVVGIIEAPDGSATADGFDDRFKETLARLATLGQDYTDTLIKET